MADAVAIEHGWTPLKLRSRDRGTAFLVYRIFWFALLTLAVVAPAAGVFYREQTITRIWNPFSLVGLQYVIEDGATVRLRPFSVESRDSGIAAGDRIVAIDGQPVRDRPSDLAAIARRLDGPEGSTVTIATRSPDGTLGTHRLTRTGQHIRERFAGSGIDRRTSRTIVLILGLFPNYLLLAAAFLLFRRRARDPVAALLSVSFLMLAACTFHAHFVYERLDLDALRGILSVAGWCIFILVLLIFPDGRFMPRWTRWAALALLPFAVQSYFYLLPLQIDNGLYTLWTAAGVAFLALRYRRLSPGSERQQIRWVLFGFAAGIALISVGIGLDVLTDMDLAPLNNIWSGIVAAFLFSAGICCLAGGLLVSLLKYRLYDADAVISRSAGYAVMTVGLVAIFAATERVVEIMGERWFEGDVGALSGGIAAGMAAVVIAPMHGRIHDWAERRFQKALLRMRRDLPLCVGDLRETATMDELLAEVLARIERGVRSSHAAVLIGGRPAALRGTSAEEIAKARPLAASVDGLHCDPGDPLFPMRIPLSVDHVGAAPLGWILLGPRPDGSFYGRDEREALAEIADPIARAVRIVELREEREARLAAHEERQNRRIAQLERRVREALAALDQALPKPSPPLPFGGRRLR